jgi:hypothetical protein
MRRPVRWLGIAAAAALVALSSCSYAHRQFKPLFNEPAGYGFYSVEVDDFGTFWDRTAATDVLRQITAKSKNRNTIVLLYVHGWHHNAQETNQNLLEFRKTLGVLTQRLGEDLYAQSRGVLTNSTDVQVIGVYVGWRGRSLPGPFDYLTIWPRKQAAERVGDGDLREFLARLEVLYQERNTAGIHPFLGLVAVGHSLGGQVLLRSTAPEIERELVGAAEGSQPPFISGFGDLAVLVNPAVEAYQFERIHRLAENLAFDWRQTPIMVVVSADNDTPRQRMFPLARRLSRILRPPFRDHEQAELWRRALGEYKPQRTHELKLTSRPPALDASSYLNPDAVLKRDFTAELQIGGAELKLTDGPKKPNSPIVVAYSTNKLIDGHSGIWTPEFRAFLIDYVAFVEGKRMLVRCALSADCAERLKSPGRTQ